MKKKKNKTLVVEVTEQGDLLVTTKNITNKKELCEIAGLIQYHIAFFDNKLI